MKVHIAHGNPLLAAGLAAAFGTCEEFEVIADTAASTCTAGVVVADFDTGVKLALERARPLPIMIVSHEDGEAAIRHALESGVRGYLLLESPIESVIDGARTIVRGGIVIDPVAVSKIMNSLNAERLTKRELEVLCLLTQGMTDKQIASRLGNAVGTIKYHVKQLRHKLDASSRTEAIFIAQQRGLLPREPPARRATPTAPGQPVVPRWSQSPPARLSTASRRPTSFG